MKHYVQTWHSVEDDRLLDVLKHVVAFGIAIAWVDCGKRCEIGLVFPDLSIEFYRAFMRHLFPISKSGEYEDLPGVMWYSTPISPLIPGNGGEIELQDCLYVPEQFYKALDSGAKKT